MWKQDVCITIWEMRERAFHDKADRVCEKMDRGLGRDQSDRHPAYAEGCDAVDILGQRSAAAVMKRVIEKMEGM